MLTRLLLFGAAVGIARLCCDGASGAQLPRIPKAGGEPDPDVASLEFRVTCPPDVKVSPDAREKLPVFRFAYPEYTPAFINKFIDQSFGQVAREVVRQRASKTFTFVDLPGPGLRIEFDHTHLGGIWIKNLRFEKEMAEERKEPERVKPPDEQMVRLATAWLSDHHLLYQDAKSGAVLGQYQHPGPSCYSVSYWRTLPGLPHTCGVSRMIVAMSPKGTLHHVLIEWPDLEVIGEYPIIRLDEALRAVNAGKGRVLELEKLRPIRGAVTMAKLTYAGPRKRSGYVQPSYYFRVGTKAEGAEADVSIMIQAIRPEFVSDAHEEGEGAR